MNKQILILIFFLSLLTTVFTSCDNTLDLVEPGSDTPIAYGFLSASTDDQFIRLERGFIDPERPADEIAQIADSIYYSVAEVRLINLTTNKTFTLNKVDFAEQGIPREEGFFLQDPNFIYTYSGEETDFNNLDNVRVEIDRGDNFETVFTEIQLLEDILIITPKENGTTSFPSLSQFKMQWVPGNENPGQRYKINFYLYYNEADLTDAEPEPVEKMLKWNFTEVVGESVAEVPGIEFYKFFASNLEADPKYVRTFEYFDIEVIYSGQELEDYRDFLSANTGITSSQPIPPYTNLSSGYGLIAEREYAYQRNIFISPTTKDSLSDGVFTKNLGFQ